jgi:acid-sensing ion channel, other
VAMERAQLYGPTELVAHFGGLLGLFLGFSLMSVLELVYFCTIRLIYDFKNVLFKKKLTLKQ